MGNTSTKEQRSPSTPGFGQYHGHRHHDAAASRDVASPENANPLTPLYSSRANRGSRPDLSFLGLGSSSHTPDPPEVRRETKQEREARKLEKERAAREKERERSMKEEHVDGGYLVTQGVYTGTEDFNKAVVRQLMIERRIAPFWRGLNDFQEDWTEHQLIAAARGLHIPAADEIPAEDLANTTTPEPLTSANANTQTLTVPISGRSDSCASDVSSNLSPSHPAFSLPPTTSPLGSPGNTPSLSPFRPRSKTLASLTTSNKGTSQENMVPREVQLPKDPYVNGQAMEAFLYKDATECPICFIYYPPYLNKTRCCDQPICSECFVQIKRPDPHPPEHSDPSSPPVEPQENPEALVSEPANCPYCQQAEFGVTYEPPPFRRGLAYANISHSSYSYGLGAGESAMSSTSSLGSVGSPTLRPAGASRRRTTSISANASTVVTTDRVRPDWATKLANARNHAARRSAAATALHTAAYLMGNGVGADNRAFGFPSRGRFGRSREGTTESGSATPSSGGPDVAARLAAFSTLAEQHQQRAREASQPGSSSRRRSRMDDLEDMMMMEAIRLSLAAEEERKRKEEKEAKKEAKKKEKAEKKAEKAAKKTMYSAGSSASASGSALSLSLPGVGRRRGNSGSSAVLRDAVTNNIGKGKGVDRSAAGPVGESSGGASPVDILPNPVQSHGQHLDIGSTFSRLDAPASPTTTTAPDRPSHLRQMSNASSPASSFIESVPGSLRNGFHSSTSSHGSPNASHTHLGGTPEQDGDAGSAGTEPMFNFRSLAAIVGREDKKEGHDHPEIEYSEKLSLAGGSLHQRGESSSSVFTSSNDTESMDRSIATLKADDYESGETGEPGGTEEQVLNGCLTTGATTTPDLLITPVTPAPINAADEDSKQLGMSIDLERERQATQ